VDGGVKVIDSCLSCPTSTGEDECSPLDCAALATPPAEICEPDLPDVDISLEWKNAVASDTPLLNRSV